MSEAVRRAADQPGSAVSWLDPLVEAAVAALDAPGPMPVVEADDRTLARAWECCRSITAHHSRTFSFAARLLPAQQRRAIWALYAFCRTTDDIADRGRADAAEQLASWRTEVMGGRASAEGLVPVAWADARRRYRIPAAYPTALIDTIAQDLVQTRYPTFDELARYCFGVASTVGLMTMHIVGFSGPEAVPYAIKLGVAMQLTNILRDVAEDWRLGRVYLPQDELAKFGLTEGDIAHGEVNDRWRRFSRFQIERTFRLYREGWDGLRYLHRGGRFAIAAAAELYSGILCDIERHDHDVFSRRAYVSQLSKLARLPGIWARVQLGRGFARCSRPQPERERRE